MAKRRANKSSAISTLSEAEKAATDWIEPRKLSLIIHSADDLLSLARKIWEDAYAAGRSDARYDAAVEAAEAEWFNG